MSKKATIHFGTDNEPRLSVGTTVKGDSHGLYVLVHSRWHKVHGPIKFHGIYYIGKSFSTKTATVTLFE